MRGFLDHLCHPVSLLIYLLGMPSSLYYERAASGAGVATFAFESGAIASVACTVGAANNGGMERTTIVSDRGRHIVVEQQYPRQPASQSAGRSGKRLRRQFGGYFTGAPGQTTAAWEPEFSLGHSDNKGLFLQGYYGEVNEFARAILENRAPAKGGLEHAWQATRIFEAFAEGPRKAIQLL